MISLSSIGGLAGPFFLPVAMVMAASKRLLLAVAVRVVLFFSAVCLAFIPINGLPVVEYIRAFFGDLSITTLFLLFTSSISTLAGRDFYKSQNLCLFMVIVLAAGLFLYPFSLGLTYFDSYALGYNSKAFLAVLFLVTLTAWYFNIYLVVIIIVLDMSACLLGIYESRNLWDYLIDPLLTLYAFFWLFIDILKRIVGRSRCAAEKTTKPHFKKISL